MSKLLVGLIGIVVGAILGVMLIAPVLTGAAAGVGVATGLGAGICSTVAAAQEEGFLTAEQVDQVLNRADGDMAAMAGAESPSAVVGSASECDAVTQKLRDANS